MTRIVTIFFAAVAFLMAVYWVVPGAKPPGMIAVATAPSAPSHTVVLLPDAGPAAAPQQSQTIAAPAAPAVLPVAAVLTVPSATVRTAKVSTACTGDAITCMLEGKNVADDPTDVTGSIVPTSRHPAPLPRPFKAVR